MTPATNPIPDLPIVNGIAKFAEDLRARRVSSEQVTEAYLARIEALNPRLEAFTHVASERALRTAQGLDRLLAGGTDLGPLMGVPVAIKDLYSVEGMPTRAGTRIDVADLVEPEGSFIRAMKRAGCVILGKTQTTEFALGTINLSRQPPWNPWDALTRRMPGGSSSGSAVALAADLCAFSVGSDTGGSVRLPAALCGTFGYKASEALWPLDGVFPLAPSMDSIGTFCHTARDASLVFSALTGRAPPAPCSLGGLRLGKPSSYFFEDLDPAVERGINSVLAKLEDAGVELVEVDLPGSDELAETFGRMVPAELIAFIGRERFTASRDVMDPVAWTRAGQGLDYPADIFLRARRRRNTLRAIAHARLGGLDGVIMPTSPALPIPVTDCTTVDDAVAWNRRSLRNTQPINLLGLCAVSLPLGHDAGGPLPVGLQIACAHDCDSRLLSIAMAIETLIGPGTRPDLSGFA